MPIHSYLTIQSEAKGLFKEKGSRFLSFAYPVATESEIKEIIEGLKREHFDARHHCYAWILGAEKKQFRAVDDGEPNHSAGDPILGQIRSRDLTNILVVVIRYFGGVKLGVGGLIMAYKSAAGDALKHANIVEQEVCERIEIAYSYAATTEVMRLVNTFDMKVVRQEFREMCALEADLPLKNKDRFDEKVRLLHDLGSSIDVLRKSK